MSEYFPEPKSLEKTKVELDLYNYATKTNLKNATGINTLSFAKKVDLTSLKSNVNKLNNDKLKNVPTNLINVKSKVDKLDVDKLLPVPVDLSKLSYVIKNDVVKKDVYNAKTKNIEDKIPDITNLATKTTLNCFENKIPSLRNLVNKTEYNTKINEIEKKLTDHSHDKYIAIPEFHKSKSENFAAGLKQVNLASKCDIANFVN